ncbi:short-chain dehydrogenase/reductase SDR [Gloeothece citriformis PCC 7424]|uniref:Short-chain dehydrogenase/reductase SDR n=1 Tax=Gloeothece citriformis (strain PCC 7424) TaxID=65393 RepID=B7KH75_GLOC7|nr:SDR family NAD(P)-dependent oxidoreductase [Gloeothece citriformis]ACK69284.1 short-chain dehydrogenase/reductase SDR [Gloeothece citriformis PCC 7424]
MSNFSKIQSINVLIVGASRGIGLGFVEQLLNRIEVEQIFATYRLPTSATELLTLESQAQGKLSCLPMDLTIEDQIIEGINQIQSRVNQLHLVINCVGILHEGELKPSKSLKQVSSDYFMRYFQVNSIGSVLLAKHLIPLFRHDQPSIFASISAKIGSIGDNQLGGWYGYRASKAALNMLMKTVSIEYGRISPKTIVVTLHPGTTNTDLSKPFQKNVPPEKLFSVERTVKQLLTVIDNLTEHDSGQFFSWDGTRLPW